MPPVKAICLVKPAGVRPLLLGHQDHLGAVPGRGGLLQFAQQHPAGPLPALSFVHDEVFHDQERPAVAVQLFADDAHDRTHQPPAVLRRQEDMAPPGLQDFPLSPHDSLVHRLISKWRVQGRQRR